MPVLFSRACEYALRGLVEMARDPQIEQWTVQDLAQRTETPAPFLAKTFQTLVKHKVLKSSKGRHGGFALLETTKDLSILDIVHIIDGPALSQDCALGFRECGVDAPCPIHEQWAEIRQTLVQTLGGQTLYDFADKL